VEKNTVGKCAVKFVCTGRERRGNISYLHFQRPCSFVVSFPPSQLPTPPEVRCLKNIASTWWLDGHWPVTGTAAKVEFCSLIIAKGSGCQPVERMPSLLVYYPKVLTLVPHASQCVSRTRENTRGSSGEGNLEDKGSTSLVLETVERVEHSAPFFTSLITAALSHRNPASTGPFCYGCRA
jgi:hypothetical protein